MCYDHPALCEPVLVTVNLNRLSVKPTLLQIPYTSCQAGTGICIHNIPNLDAMRFSVHSKLKFLVSV